VLTLDDVFLALLIAAVITTVFSVPGIFMTVYRSSRNLKRYKVIRSIEGMGVLPAELMAEWESVKSTMAYSSMISDELERLGALRPALFQTTVSAALLAIIAAFSEMETAAFAVVVALLVVAVFSVLFGRSNSIRYAHEYEGLLKELESNGQESCGSMYA